MGYGVREGVLGALVVGWAAWAAPARADWEPAGGVSLVGLFPGQSDVGGELLVDLAHAFPSVQLGVALGVGALSSDADDRSRVFMPLGLSAAWAPDVGAVGPLLRLRAGAWGGATNDGLALGGWFTATAQLAIAVSPSLDFVIGAEGTALVGHGSRWALGPSVGLSFTPEQIESW